jgi:hypothetical protein
MLLARAFIKQ